MEATILAGGLGTRSLLLPTRQGLQKRLCRELDMHKFNGYLNEQLWLKYGNLY